MIATEGFQLMAHLLRRAGFGATYTEIQEQLSEGYESTIETYLQPSDSDSRHLEDDVIRRYHSDIHESRIPEAPGSQWVYRMVTTNSPLEEKIALFWHGIFATGFSKTQQGPSLFLQIETFRELGLGKFDDLLLAISKDPVMIMWLDNQDNHKGAINENFGRELLELFSMGIGNYTETDIKECARAFTGWTLDNAEYMEARSLKASIWPYGGIAWHYDYRDEDHDHGAKEFLGERGNFNGDDIIEIICRNPATARFIARHIYDFFVADEAPVPQWPYVPPVDPDAIEILADAYLQSNHDISSVLRVLFNSDFFKQSRFARVKCPAEFVAGTVKIVDTDHFPSPGLARLPAASTMMGQELLNPPTVEGWHTGKEWIDGGTLAVRVDFAVQEVSDSSSPGVRAIVERLGDQGRSVSPEEFVDICLDLIGPMEVGEETHAALLKHAREAGPLSFENGIDPENVATRVVRLLQLIVSAREYQFA